MTTDQTACPPLFLGIEGGATRTVAFLADASERVFSRVESGPANLQLMTDTELVEHLKDLARPMFRPAAIAIGLAGLRSEQDRARLLQAASHAWPGIPCCACSDLETAMAAAEPPQAAVGARVLVLSGTGSCCFGQSSPGLRVRMGGWGHWLGDKGSGYEIGMRALKACVYYYDRDNVWPRLGSAILRVLQLNEPEDLIGWVQTAQKHEIAVLALEVFDAWKRRDKIASDILHGAAASLGKDGASCAKRLVRPGSRVQFILAGSVLVKQPRFGKLVSTELVQHWPQCEITSLRQEGAMGAVRLAQLEWGGGAVGQAPGQGMGAGRRKAASTISAASVHKSYRSEALEAAGLIPRGTQLSPTEQRNPRSIGLDKLPLDKAVALMLAEEAQVTKVLDRQLPAITRCIRMIVRAFRQGGRLLYVGAGTSGRLGVLDASECPPTFRVSPEQVQGIIAGGQQALWQSFEGAEDDFPAGARAMEFRGVTAQDVVVGIAASGRTPFVWGALAAARRAGARTAFVCFNPHLQISREQRPNVLLAFDLGPEVLTGSTRLKAGTATKLLLNVFTTLSMVRMGKVVSNLMVDVNPSNEKLRERAIRIVRELTSASGPEAAQALEEAGWVVKQALERLKRIKKTRSQPAQPAST